jgi:N-acyl-D-aspartate/D-glutamate deacylase
MGGDSQHRVATAEEVAAMGALVREAMAAGAIGLGSSTAEAHVGEGGLPVASRLADRSEFLALTKAMGESGRGLFQITIGPKTTLEDLREIWRTSGRPAIWAAFFQRDDRPEYVPERLAVTEAFHREGVEVLPQISCRPLTMDFTMKNPYPFEGMPAWQAVMKEPESRWLAVYGDPAFRAALKADLDARRFAVFRGRWDLVQVLRTSRPEHKTLEGRSLADLARETGKHPVDAWLDLVTADGLDVEFLAGLLNTDERVVGDLIVHPLTLITLSDAGAHLSLMCDAGYSSTLLGKWVRQVGRLTLEAAVKRLTDDPARAYRIPRRGRLEPGYWADVAIFDPATVDALPVEWVTDLPGGEGRFVSRARGVEWSLVNGRPVLERGRVVEQPAGQRPGQVLRRFEA